MIRMTCLFLLAGNLCFGQTESFITWRFQAEAKCGNEISVVFNATLLPGWHLYSQFINHGGPQPTQFSFEENDAIELIGRVRETGTKHKYYDDIYEMDIAFFEDSVEFIQQAKAIKSAKNIKGRVNFMICNHEICIPRRQEFNILLPQQ